MDFPHEIRLEVTRRSPLEGEADPATARVPKVERNPSESHRRTERCTTILIKSLTRNPQLLIGQHQVLLGNRHVIPILLFLRSSDPQGATVADIGRALFPDLRGEALRNKVKNARVHFHAALDVWCIQHGRPSRQAHPLRIASVGHSRETRLHLETDGLRWHWDLELLERALDRGTSNWLRLLPTYEDEFLAGYGLEVEEGWVQRIRLRLKTRLLERAAGLMADWHARGWNEPVRGLAARLLERGLLDPTHPSTDAIAALEVEAVEAHSGREAALAVWVAHDERFRAAFVEAPALTQADPRTRN